MEENDGTQLIVQWSNNYSILQALVDALTNYLFWFAEALVIAMGLVIWYAWNRKGHLLFGRGDKEEGELLFSEPASDRWRITRGELVSRVILAVTSVLSALILLLMVVNTYTEGKNNDFRNQVSAELADRGFFIGGNPPGYGESVSSVLLSRTSSFASTTNCQIHNVSEGATHVITMTCGSGRHAIPLS